MNYQKPIEIFEELHVYCYDNNLKYSTPSYSFNFVQFKIVHTVSLHTKQEIDWYLPVILHKFGSYYIVSSVLVHYSQTSDITNHF